jgi:L,D-transpeptidase catalytic domain
MIPLRIAAQLTAALATLLFASCANQKPTDPVTKKTEESKFVNPHAAGTYDHFKAEPSYPKTHSVWKNDALLSQTNAENSSIRISLEKQRAFMMNGEEIAMDYPICSGIASRPTPTGTFYILEKIVDKRSNKYGRIMDASGDVTNSNAESGLDPIPEGGKFLGAEMRYWMRLTNDGVGHHIGPVKRRPASHACVRGPSATMPVVYSKVKLGTRVTIE